MSDTTPDIHHFASSVAKITKDGEMVISNYIAKGETLTNGVTFDEVLQGILVKEPEVKHQDNTHVLTTEDTKTSTVQVNKKKSTKKTAAQSESDDLLAAPKSDDKDA